MEYTVKPDEIRVGNGQDTVSVKAIGSGVAVFLHDAEKQLGGAVYSLCTLDGQSETHIPRGISGNLELLMQNMLDAGAVKENIAAKIVGGATIFSFHDKDEDSEAGKNIVRFARKWLGENKVKLKAEDTGDCFGRSALLRIADGSIEIRLVNQYTYII